jgi:hypothetical protein
LSVMVILSTINANAISMTPKKYNIISLIV